MKTKTLQQLKFYASFIFLIGLMLVLIIGCNEKEDAEMNTTNNSDISYTVTIGVYILKDGKYENQNRDLIFDTQEACQSWTRSALPDIHSSASHLHYNAAKNTTYDANTEVITWTEYGPELDQSSIDAVCEDGSDGVVKTANKTDYTPIQNFYLKITSVVEK